MTTWEKELRNTLTKIDCPSPIKSWIIDCLVECRRIIPKVMSRMSYLDDVKVRNGKKKK